MTLAAAPRCRAERLPADERAGEGRTRGRAAAAHSRSAREGRNEQVPSKRGRELTRAITGESLRIYPFFLVPRPGSTGSLATMRTDFALVLTAALLLDSFPVRFLLLLLFFTTAASVSCERRSVSRGAGFFKAVARELE